MECISCKLIFKIDYNLYKDTKIDKQIIRNRNPKLLADIEGDLKITVNSEIVFKEKNVLLLEFGVYLYKWLNKNINKNIDFIYDTMDYEYPILEFRKKTDNNKWVIKSILTKNDILVELDYDNISNGSLEFINDINSDFKKMYGIDIQYFSN